MGRPIEGSLERVLASAQNQTSPNPSQSNLPSNIQISNISDAWQISGVAYRNGIYSVDLAKSLLENGSAKTQDDWAAYAETAIAQNGFRTPDYPLLYGIVKALYIARNDVSKAQEVEEAKQFLKSSARAKWLMTLTRVKYQATGEDEVIHNHGTRERYSKNVNFVGSDELISSTNNILPYQFLLGTADDANEIKNTFEWLNGTNTYLWRVNSKQDTERVAGFGAGSDWAGLVCGGVASGAYSSLGVRIGAVGTAGSQK